MFSEINGRYLKDNKMSINTLKNNTNQFFKDFANCKFTNKIKNSEMSVSSIGVPEDWIGPVNSYSYNSTNKLAHIQLDVNQELTQLISSTLEPNEKYTVIFYVKGTVGQQLKFGVKAASDFQVQSFPDFDKLNDVYEEILLTSTITKYILQFQTNSSTLIGNHLIYIKNSSLGVIDIDVYKIILYKGILEISDLPSAGTVEQDVKDIKDSLTPLLSSFDGITSQLSTDLSAHNLSGISHPDIREIVSRETSGLASLSNTSVTTLKTITPTAGTIYGYKDSTWKMMFPSSLNTFSASALQSHPSSAAGADGVLSTTGIFTFGIMSILTLNYLVNNPYTNAIPGFYSSSHPISFGTTFSQVPLVFCSIGHTASVVEIFLSYTISNITTTGFTLLLASRREYGSYMNQATISIQVMGII